MGSSPPSPVRTPATPRGHCVAPECAQGVVVDRLVGFFSFDGGGFVVEVDAYPDSAQAAGSVGLHHHQEQAQQAGASLDRGRAGGGCGGHMPRLAARHAEERGTFCRAAIPSLREVSGVSRRRRREPWRPPRCTGGQPRWSMPPKVALAGRAGTGRRRACAARSRRATAGRGRRCSPPAGSAGSSTRGSKDTPLGSPRVPAFVRIGTAQPLDDARFPAIVPLLGAGHLTIDADARAPAGGGLLRAVLLLVAGRRAAGVHARARRSTRPVAGCSSRRSPPSPTPG